jgi:hypothetical protein
MEKTRFYFKLTLTLSITFLIAFYSIYQTKDLVVGPVINIYQPKNGDVFSKSMVEIKGTTQNISIINLNDRPIFVDEEGNFSELLLLSYGYNVIKMEVSDKFDRKITKTLELIYQIKTIANSTIPAAS